MFLDTATYTGPALELHKEGGAKFGGITAQSFLTQGEIPEEGGTGKKMSKIDK